MTTNSIGGRTGGWACRGGLALMAILLAAWGGLGCEPDGKLPPEDEIAPDAVDVPLTPNEPNNPDNPVAPEAPGDPENPDDPGDPENPDDPETPVTVPVTPFLRAELSPDGRYLLVQRDTDKGFCLVVVDVEEGEVHVSEGACDLRWFAFSPDGEMAFLLSANGLDVDVLTLATLHVVPGFKLANPYTVLEVSPDGEFLVLSNKPMDEWSEAQYEWSTYLMDLRRITVVDLAHDAVHEQFFPYAVRSTAFSPVDRALLVAMSWWKADGLPEAQVHFMNTATGVVENTIVFPNCADEVVVQPEGELAILAPTQCFVHPITLAPEVVPEEFPDAEEEWDEWDEADPCSVIDLVERKFVGNLPGFGPVAFSGDGQTAVAFSRQETMMKQWNMFQQKLVGLIFIRMSDLYWKVVEYGTDEPDYFFDLGSQHLYLHDREGGTDRLVRMEADSKNMDVLTGPPATFEEKAEAPDGTLYLVHEGKLLSVAPGGLETVDVNLSTAAGQVFSRPQGDSVVVYSQDGSSALLVGHPEGSVLSTVVLP